MPRLDSVPSPIRGARAVALFFRFASSLFRSVGAVWGPSQIQRGYRGESACALVAPSVTHPRAGGRGDGLRAAGAGTGPLIWHPKTLWRLARVADCANTLPTFGR